MMAEYSGEHKVGWNTIAVAMKATGAGVWLRACCPVAIFLVQDMIKKITDMKFEMPRQSEAGSDAYDDSFHISHAPRPPASVSGSYAQCCAGSAS